MTALSNLKLVAAKRIRQHPVEQRRNRLAAKIFEQRRLAAAQLEGTTYEPKVFRSVRNSETGARSTLETNRRLKPWWWVAENGKVCLNVKYGSKVIELAKGKTAIEVGSVAELLPTFDALKSAVLTGELDNQIEALSATLRSHFLKK